MGVRQSRPATLRAVSTADALGNETPASRTSPGLALVVVGVITAVAALIILALVFGTSNTRATVDGEKSTSTVPLVD